MPVYLYFYQLTNMCLLRYVLYFIVKLLMVTIYLVLYFYYSINYREFKNNILKNFLTTIYLRNLECKKTNKVKYHQLI